MAKKKNPLDDFTFDKFEKLDSGLEIPISNSLRTPEEPVSGSTVNHPEQKKDRRTLPDLKQKTVKPKDKKPSVQLPTLNYTGKSVEALVNVVPTSVVPTTTRAKLVATAKREKIVDTATDLHELGSLPTKNDKILYLARRGWSLKVEQRRGTLYHYATKYINRKKQRIYLGSINEGDTDPRPEH